MHHALTAAALTACAAPSPMTTDDTPKEFGHVQWGRALEPALEASRASGKPVLLFFQEVPG